VPELPEVETARRRAERALRGRRIAAVATAPDPIVYHGVSPSRFAAALRGRRVLAVRRKGKHLWMELDRRPWPLFHFGMTGSFEIYRDGAPRPRFWKVEIAMEDGTRLAMPDPRRFGRIRLQERPEDEPPLARLGFDPLEGLPPARDLGGRLRRRGGAVKSVLLDQSLFAGVGNWIADEALYQAAIDPRRPASSLAHREVARLRARLHAIVRRAVAVGADDARFPAPGSSTIAGGARRARGPAAGSGSSTSRSAAARRPSSPRASDRTGAGPLALGRAAHPRARLRSAADPGVGHRGQPDRHDPERRPEEERRVVPVDLHRELEGEGRVEDRNRVLRHEPLGLPHHATHHGREQGDARAAVGQRTPRVPARPLAEAGEDEAREQDGTPGIVPGRVPLHGAARAKERSDRVP